MISLIKNPTQLDLFLVDFFIINFQEDSRNN